MCGAHPWAAAVKRPQRFIHFHLGSHRPPSHSCGNSLPSHQPHCRLRLHRVVPKQPEHCRQRHGERARAAASSCGARRRGLRPIDWGDRAAPS